MVVLSLCPDWPRQVTEQPGSSWSGQFYNEEGPGHEGTHLWRLPGRKQAGAVASVSQVRRPKLKGRGWPGRQPPQTHIHTCIRIQAHSTPVCTHTYTHRHAHRRHGEPGLLLAAGVWLAPSRTASVPFLGQQAPWAALGLSHLCSGVRNSLLSPSMWLVPPSAC